MRKKLTAGALTASFLIAFGLLSQAGERPNVVLLFVDDMGWKDTGVTGSDLYETPNIDRLAADGLLFTDAYSSCTVCSPSRASLMTGMAPERHRVTDWIGGWWGVWNDQRRSQYPLRPPEWTRELELRHETLADLMQGAGYRTALVGKWHLTPPSDDLEAIEPYFPQNRGFDVNIAGNRFGQPGSYYWPYVRPGREAMVVNFPPREETTGLYLTDMKTNYVVGLIQEWKDDPFFIYVPYYQVHTPIQGRHDLTDKYRRKLAAGSGFQHTDPQYAAMVEALDQSVGRIHAKLEELGLDENTLLIFTSDNGGLDNGNGRPTSNAPLREGKGTAYEGGVRVPAMIHWPAVVPAGGVSREPIITHDLFPTILQAAGVELDAERRAQVDGLSLFPLMEDPSASLDRNALFWHYPHYHIEGARPYTAVRSGDWRAIHFYEGDRIELYNLAEDIGETNDLSEAMPEKAAEMRAMIDARRSEVDAQDPRPNPIYTGN